MRYRSGYIEDDPLICLRVLRIYYLDRDGPAGVLAALDSLEQIAGLVIRVRPRDTFGFLASQVPAAPIGFHMDLDVFERAVLVCVSTFDCGEFC